MENTIRIEEDCKLPLTRKVFCARMIQPQAMMALRLRYCGSEVEQLTRNAWLALKK